MIVYKALNTVTGKCYVGITTQSLDQRIREHRRRADAGLRNHKFYLSIRKHGFSSFEWSILDTAESAEELRVKEQDYIAQFGSYSRGYNSTPGDGLNTPETRALISAALKGRNVTWGQKTKAARIANGGYVSRKDIVGELCPTSKSYVVTTPQGVTSVIVGLRAYCRDHNLSHNLMLAVVKGVQTHHKGFTCKHVLEPSTTIPRGSTLQANGSGNGEHP